jgi:lipoprotein signal peptidase
MELAMRDSIRRLLSHPLTLRFALVASVVLFADQLTKTLVRGGLTPCSGNVCDHLRLGPMWVVNSTNPVGAFSFGPGSPGMWVVVMLLGALVVPVYAKRLGPNVAGGWNGAVAFGLMAGGFLGNLVDRIAFGGVTDYLSPSGYVIFNLADVAVVVGTVMMVGLLLRATRIATQSA